MQGDWKIAEVGRRNRNFKVIRARNRGLFVKQVKSAEPQAVSTLWREAAFYRLVSSDSRYAAARPMLPSLVHHDNQRHALVVELIAEAESLAERQMREGLPNRETMRLLGQTLGSIHSLAPLFADDRSFATSCSYSLPWPLTLDQTGYEFLQRLGAIGPELSRALQQLPVLRMMLSSLRAVWEYDSLIHGDMKWDNCLVSSGENGDPRLTIVDWELVDIGDGAWDIAGVFKEVITAVLVSGLNYQNATQVQGPTSSSITIESTQPLVRMFWKAYSSVRNLSNPASYFERAVRLSAARMVVGVTEYLFNSTQLGQLGTTMLQIAENILQNPLVATHQLMGNEARMDG